MKKISLALSIILFCFGKQVYAQLPGPAGTISGGLACEGKTTTASVPVIPNATSYEWIPTGPISSFVISGNTVTVGIPIDFPFTVLHLTVRGRNSSGYGAISSADIPVYKTPGSLGVISGPTSVCPGQSGTFTTNPIPNVQNYLWSSTFYGGGGSTPSYTFNFPANFTGGNINAYGLNAGCAGPTSTLYVSAIQPAGAAGTITGTSTVSPSQTAVVYSVPAIANATGYSWNVPPGASITSGQNTNSITVNYSAATASGNVSVAGTNCLGNGASSSLPITINLPPVAAGTISGRNVVCTGQTSGYFVSAIANATSYEWVAENAPVSIIPPGNGTNIGVSFPSNYPSSNITLKVRGVNSFGVGAFSPTLTIAALPGLPSLGTISGPTQVCAGQTNITYSVTPNAVVSDYYWSSPFSNNSGGVNPSFTVNFPANFTGGNISVNPVNGGCSGPPSSLAVSLAQPVAAAGTISGPATVSSGQTGVVYSVPAISNAVSYTWSVPAGATIASGQNTRSITVNYTSSATPGNISVYGTNCLGNGGASSLSVVIGSPPAAAGAITGNTIVCTGRTGSFSVPVIANVTSYEWVCENAAITILSVSNNTVVIGFPANWPGTFLLKVRGVNPYGTGAFSPVLMVNAYPQLSALGAISGPTEVCAGQSNVTYTVNSAPDVKNYYWSTPMPATMVATPSFTVNFPSNFTGGTILVQGYHGDCTGPVSTLNVSLAQPVAAAGTITGPTTVCSNQAGVVYSVPDIPNAKEYVWSLPPGATITSGEKTRTITVTHSATAGTVSVYGKNCIGNGTSSPALAISMIAAPATPGAITGNTVACADEANLLYTVPPVANATSYVWRYTTAGNTVSSEGPSTSFGLTAPSNANGLTIGVKGKNQCFTGPETTLLVPTTVAMAANNASHSVDLVTGTLSASIPLDVIQDGDVQVPLSIGYTAGGVRVTDDDGWVGIGWNVSAQAFRVSREMRGLPDDYTAASPDNRKGWLNSTTAASIKNFTPSNDNVATTCTDEVANYNFLNTLDYNQDTEPDAFRVNAPGLSFEFYFDENKQPQVIPQQDVVITPNTVTGPITSFTITDARGVQYVFSEKEALTQSLTGENPYYFVRRCQLYKTQFTYTTAWCLTKIVSPIYGTIDLTYKTVNTADNYKVPNNKWSVPYKYKTPLIAVDYFNRYSLIGGTPISDWKLSIEYSRSSILKIVDKISAPTMEARFISAPKITGESAERLSSIDIYDKHEGTPKLAKQFVLTYKNFGASTYSPAKRAFLAGVKQIIACMEAQYSMTYYEDDAFPGPSTLEKDEWEFHSGNGSSRYYDETSVTGSLKSIRHPMKGYTAFFYEAHDYIDMNNNTVQGGGSRIRKIISHDAVSSAGDIVTEYLYKDVFGKSAGLLQYKALTSFSVAKMKKLYLGPGNMVYNDIPYREASVLYPSYTADQLKQKFSIAADQDLSATTSFMNGSVVAYKAVTVKTKGAGRTDYEFDVPLGFGFYIANAGEWNASKVFVARPSTGGSACYEAPNINGGFDHYPFPPNPNYDFAKGVIKRVIDYREDGMMVRDVGYMYQRIYGNGSSIRKIYGLALEELPTYYHNGTAYVNAKMFLYSKYEVFTDVKLVLLSQTEVRYSSTDLTKKLITGTTYSYESTNHRELTKTTTLNSDGTTSVARYTNVKDYAIANPSDPKSIALVNLKGIHRILPVETIYSKFIGGTEYYLGSNLMTYKSTGVAYPNQPTFYKVYPDKQYSFSSSNGSTTFKPAYVVGGTTFQPDDTNYVLEQTYVSFDSYGNPTQTIGRSRQPGAVVFGYNGSLPLLQISNAQIDEVRYATFDYEPNGNTYSFYTSSSAFTSCPGRNNSLGLNLPGGAANSLNTSVVNNKRSFHTFSVWVKASTSGILSLEMGVPATTFQIPFSASADWKKITYRTNFASILGNPGSFPIKITSNVAVQVDDLAFYPDQVDFVAYTYQFPYGKSSETDAYGNAAYYEYDRGGRLKTVFDRNRNVIKKYDYAVKP